MKLDKESLKKMATLPDDELWQTIRKTAEAHGISLPEGTPKKEELSRLRGILLDAEKLNPLAAMKLINDYKNRGRN